MESAGGTERATPQDKSKSNRWNCNTGSKQEMLVGLTLPGTKLPVSVMVRVQSDYPRQRLGDVCASGVAGMSSLTDFL